MTDDLVKRLREHVIHLDAWGKEAIHDANIIEEAADHIEKLEAALRKISQQDTLWGAICKAKHALGDFDRKALEGKDVE